MLRSIELQGEATSHSTRHSGNSLGLMGRLAVATMIRALVKVFKKLVDSDPSIARPSGPARSERYSATCALQLRCFDLWRHQLT